MGEIVIGAITVLLALILGAAAMAVADSGKKEEKERVAEDEIRVYRVNGYTVIKGPAEMEIEDDC